ncbi:metallophosphoesterase [Nonomuraea sp. K274]|uniref:Metallophosphoesterase n=1 Tax=Nonomuraea cypriaca TaxID=1187855 RepID=A0A931ABV9_9ACTN|nr:metallophosphoesterase [Nonomuraea cypriaca]MBF8187150.1 metallophosphoesterase [Nonomuraea cypriaca]
MRKSLFLAALIAATVAVPSGPAYADPAVTFALIGDTPYGDAQQAAFPSLVESIDADAGVRFVLHAGDVKNGSTTCDDARFSTLAGLFGTFDDPFVLTPGDNEWTDCHRAAAGGYLPTERLDAIRRIFYPVAGRTLGGHPMGVRTQARDPRHRDYRENVLFTRAGVVFATVHVVGSDNDLAPWSELPGGDRPAERTAEFEARQSAALDWIDNAFDVAGRTHAPGVLLMMQAEPVETSGFAEIRARVVERARAFGKPVLLTHGDEHVYEVERGYAGVANLTRLETYGDTAAHWLRVTADPKAPAVFSWQSRTVES